MSFPGFSGLRSGHYAAILCDPPWEFKGYSANTIPHRSAEAPYQPMSLEDLFELPVTGLASKDCALFMWSIGTHLDQSMELGKKWGFTYKTKVFEWIKLTKNGLGCRMGMGKWSRQETESVLLFTRGHPKRLNAGVRSTIFSEVREHSRKPDEQYTKIEALVGGPYCELFAKYRWPGWDGWGDQYPL